MIRTCRLEEFVGEVIQMHNDEQKEKTLWDVWLHRIFDKSYNEFMESIGEGSGVKTSDEELAEIVSDNRNMLKSFIPEG